MFGLLWRSALGASAHDPGWHPKFPYSLKDSEDDDFVYLFYEEDRLFARSALRGKIPYSLRRAFGWYNIELDGERLSPLGCGRSAQVSLEHVTMSPELSACRPGMDLGSQGCSNIIRGKEPQECNNSLAAACYWMLYWRRQGKDDRESLPVSQHLLEYRQRVLCHLKHLDDQKMLDTKVRSLWLAKTDDDVDTQRETNLHAALTATQPSETAPPHPGPSHNLSVETEVTENKQPIEDAPLSVHQLTQAQAIVDQLRSIFASSEYVQRHTKLCEKIEKVDPNFKFRLPGNQTRRGRPGFRFLGYSNSPGMQDAARKEQVIWEDLSRSLAPRAGRSKKSRNDRDLYGLIPSQLQTKFESAVQSWASDPDGRNASRLQDGKDFLAFVALALTDWDSYALTAWQPHNDLQIVADELRMHLVTALSLGVQSRMKLERDFWESDGGGRFKSLVMDFTTGILYNGLYLAPPENPVSRIFQLRDKDAVVYLL